MVHTPDETKAWLDKERSKQDHRDARRAEDEAEMRRVASPLALHLMADLLNYRLTPEVMNDIAQRARAWAIAEMESDR